MKLLTCVCGVIAALAIVVTATGQEEEKKTEKRKALTILLFDADTKGITKGIKQIDIPEEKVAKKVRLADAVAKPPPEGWLDQFKLLLGGTAIDDPKREWVVKSVKMTLADDKVVECQVLSLRDTGKTTIKLEPAGDGKSVTLIDLNGFGTITSDKGKRTWHIYMAQYWDTVVIPKREKEPKDKVTSDKEKLQGKWKVISFEADGKKETEQVGMIWVFDRDKLVMGGEGDFSYRLEPSKTPKQIDATGKPEEGFPAPGMVGIYKLEGDTLTLCYSPPRKDTSRPTEFKTSERLGGALVVFRRVKAKE